jgi:hypothetical protein
MYGLSYYLMALQEVEKARLKQRAEKERRDGSLPPSHATRFPDRVPTNIEEPVKSSRVSRNAYEAMM